MLQKVFGQSCGLSYTNKRPLLVKTFLKRYIWKKCTDSGPSYYYYWHIIMMNTHHYIEHSTNILSGNWFWKDSCQHFVFLKGVWFWSQQLFHFSLSIQPHSNAHIELFTESCERLSPEDLCNWGYNSENRTGQKLYFFKVKVDN